METALLVLFLLGLWLDTERSCVTAFSVRHRVRCKATKWCQHDTSHHRTGTLALMLPIAQRSARSSLEMSFFKPSDGSSSNSSRRKTEEAVVEDAPSSGTTTNWLLFGLFSSIGVGYWYLMVLGAAAHASGFPVPDFIPMTPGWPATEEEFVPVLEDSYHFFYLSELLGNQDAPYVIPPRLAVFNIVEAWIFAMLPALWQDSQRRLPRPILLVSWLLLGINLTNGFLAPYLAITETRYNQDMMNFSGVTSTEEKESIRLLASSLFRRVFGSISLAVVIYALYQSIIVATPADWSAFGSLVHTDRSYLAFCVDPVLFAMVQPCILGRVKNWKLEPIDYVPFVGLMVWLWKADE